MIFYHMDLKFSMYQAEYIKKWFQKLKSSGFDGVVIEIDNKLVFPSHSGFAAADALSAAEWRDIIRFGKNLGLVIYPLLQTLGHMEHVLSCGGEFTELAENPGNNYMLCPQKTSTREFIKDLISDLVDIFDKPGIIHLGGDEVYGHMERKGMHKCPLCLSMDTGELLVGYLLYLARFCMSQGVRPEFWADEVLSFPEHIGRFPAGTRFVDWCYNRTERFSDRIGLLWGAASIRGKPMSGRFQQEIPSQIKCMLPFINKGDQRFNNFYGTEFIQNQGYEAVVASGVRSSGDSYALPRLDLGMKNVSISQAASREYNCDHLVTSWAVRLSHPETTWPALNAIHAPSDNPDEPENAAIFSSYIGREPLAWLKQVSTGLACVDIPTEQKARYERPYFDNYSKALYDVHLNRDNSPILDALKARSFSGGKILSILIDALNQGRGDPDCLRHLINGVEIMMLRSEQALAIINAYHDGPDRKLLADLLERNEAILQDFIDLWRESVTVYSLKQEIAVKFTRDISMLKNLLNS